MRRNRVVLDEVTLQSHRSHTGARQSSGIPPVREDQLGGSAADIQQQMGSISKGHPGEDTEIDQSCLFGTADQINIDPKTILDLLEKVPAVRCFPHRTGRSGDDLLDIMADGEIPEPSERLVTSLHRRCCQLTTVGITLTETCGGLLGLNDVEGPQVGVHRSHEQMRGIGPDVDRGDSSLLARPGKALEIRRCLWMSLGFQHRHHQSEIASLCHSQPGHPTLTRVHQKTATVITGFPNLRPWIELLRWNKPTGRLILLVPAAWSLWLTPTAPPDLKLVLQIVVGGLTVSGAGCIANDLWDQSFDGKVERTRNRPLALGMIRRGRAVALLLVLLVLSLCVVLTLPVKSLLLCLALAVAALPPILLYPSAKRWFPFPQGVLALCWGFAVLIPWAASEASLNLTSPVLVSCWLSTLLWTFGFDTVYAMADRRDDAVLGLKSSALSLGAAVVPVVRSCYLLSALSLGAAAISAGVGAPFWPFWIFATVLMQISCIPLERRQASMAVFSKHFSQQVLIGTLLWIGLVTARALQP